MKVFKWRIASLILAFALVILLALGDLRITFADSTTGTVTLSAGSLTESNATTPTVSATLNGSDQTPTYSLAVTLTDATGSGNGWNLTITSTQFTTGGGSPHTLSTTASSITGVTQTCVGGATCTNATNSISYPVTVPAAASAPTSVKFFNASANTGMGKFTITPTVAVTLPANAYAGTYNSTITLAIVSGP